MNARNTNVWVVAIALGICVISIVLITALTARPVSDVARKRPSTFFTDETGTRAAYLVMDEVLLYAEQWRRPIEELNTEPDSVSTFIVMGPSRPLTESEAATLHRWVEGGGQLILALDQEWPIQKAGGKNLPQGFLARHGFELLDVVKGGLATAASVSKPFGSGRIVYVPDAYAFSNKTLRAGDNAIWLADRCDEWRDGAATFDEYHQGFGEKRGLMALIGMFMVSPWGLMFVQAGLAGAIYLFGYKQRFGRPIEELQQERRSPIEIVDAISGLFKTAQARSLAARVIQQHLKQQVPLTAAPLGDVVHPATDQQLIDAAQKAAAIARTFRHGKPRSNRPAAAV